MTTLTVGKSSNTDINLPLVRAENEFNYFCDWLITSDFCIIRLLYNIAVKLQYSITTCSLNYFSNVWFWLKMNYFCDWSITSEFYMRLPCACLHFTYNLQP